MRLYAYLEHISGDTVPLNNHITAMEDRNNVKSLSLFYCTPHLCVFVVAKHNSTKIGPKLMYSGVSRVFYASVAAVDI